MRLASLIILATLVAACSTSSGSQKKADLRSGADIGKTVSERTQEAQKNDATHVIIASSEDGESDGAKDDGEVAETTTPSPTPMTVRIGSDGQLVDSSGTTIAETPRPKDGETLHLHYSADTPTEMVTKVLDRLKDAGWTDLALKIESAKTNATDEDEPVDASKTAGSKAEE